MLMEERVKHLIAEYFDEIVAIRRDFHKYPELSEQEERTMGKISEYLTAWGIPHQTNIGGHGVVGIIEGKAPRAEGYKYEAVGIRADIDALPVTEEVVRRNGTVGLIRACSAG
ncbi:MAG: amidohydrolase, partial [Firmicutes bacterium]|nr:amidohydrolase [Bacillota bacterium]